MGGSLAGGARSCAAGGAKQLQQERARGFPAPGPAWLALPASLGNACLRGSPPAGWQGEQGSRLLWLRQLQALHCLLISVLGLGLGGDPCSGWAGRMQMRVLTGSGSCRDTDQTAREAAMPGRTDGVHLWRDKPKLDGPAKHDAALQGRGRGCQGSVRVCSRGWLTGPMLAWHHAAGKQYAVDGQGQ